MVSRGTTDRPFDRAVLAPRVERDRFRLGCVALWCLGVGEVAVILTGLMTGAIWTVMVVSVGSVAAHTLLVRMRHRERLAVNAKNAVKAVRSTFGDPRWN